MTDDRPRDRAAGAAPGVPAVEVAAPGAGVVEGAAASRWPRALLDTLARDPRVVGAADLSDVNGPAAPPRGPRVLVIVTTWDGGASLPVDLPRIGALAAGEAVVVSDRDGASWRGLTAALGRIDVRVVRIGDLKPSAAGEHAAVVIDRKGLVDQWVRWSRGRDRTRDVPVSASRDRELLDLAELADALDSISHGTTRLTPDGPRPLRPMLVRRARELRPHMRTDDAAGAALVARIDAALAASPHDGAGYRVVPDTNLPPAAALERFLGIADGEGFLGDRVLFDAAARRLAELSRRAPVFDEGFVVPTFDAVEARWRFGEGIGGCKVPLIPAVHVGVGVTPSDALEFWAAPAVRMPPALVACVADPGARVVLERTAGKDALLAALLGEVERAWDELPEFVRTARRASRSSAGDAESALRALHLPRSYREAVRAVLAAVSSPTRMQLALALARVGTGEDPLNARKLGLAAGRVLAETPAGDAGAGAACDA